MAAANYAEGLLDSPPLPLYEGLMSRVWGLPYAGGWKEQPAGIMGRMSKCLQVYDAIGAWRRSHNWTEWANQNPGQWKTVQAVFELRKANGDWD